MSGVSSKSIQDLKTACIGPELNNIVARAARTFDPDCSSGFYFHDHEEKILYLVARYNESESFPGSEGEEEGVCANMVLSRIPLHICPDYNEERLRIESFPKGVFHSLLALLVELSAETNGVLFLTHPKKNRFVEKDKHHLQPYAEEIKEFVKKSHDSELERLKRILHEVPVAVITEENGVVTSFNRRATQIFGWEPGDIIHKRLLNLYSHEEMARRVGNKLHDHGAVWNEIGTGKRGDKTVFPMRLSGLKLSFQKGVHRSVGFVENLEEMGTLNTAEILLRCTNALAMAESVDQGLNTLVDLLQGILDVEFCAAFLENRDLFKYDRVAVSGRPAKDFSSEIQISAVLPFLDSKGILFSKPRQGFSELSRQLSRQRFHSFFIIPLERNTGFIVAGFYQQPLLQLDRTKFDLLRAVASQISGFVLRLVEHESVKSAKEVNEVLFLEKGQLHEGTTARGLLEHLAQKTHEVTRCWWVSVLIEGRDGTLKGIYKHGDSDHPRHWMKSRSKGLSREIMDTRKPHWVADSRNEPERINAYVEEYGVRAVLGLPLEAGGQCLGVIWCHFREATPIKQSLLKPLQHYANQIALAYTGARKNERKDKLIEAYHKMEQLSDTGSVFDTLVRGLAESLNLSLVCCQLYGRRNEEKIPGRSAAADLNIDEEITHSGNLAMERCIVQGKADFTRDSWCITGDNHNIYGQEVDDQYQALLYVYLGANGYLRPEEQTTITSLLKHAAFITRTLLEQENNDASMALLRSIPDTGGGILSLLRDIQKKTGATGSLIGVMGTNSAHFQDIIGDLDAYRDRPFFDILANAIKDGPKWPGCKELKKARQLLQRKSHKDLAALPLHSGGDLVGILLLVFARSRDLSQKNKDALEMTSHTLAHVVANTQLSLENNLRRCAMKELHRIGQDSLQSLDYAKTLDRLVKQGRALITSKTHCAVEIWTIEGEELVIQATTTGLTKNLSRVKLNENRALTACCKNKNTIYYPDTKQLAPNTPYKQDYDWVRSEMVVPILADEKVLGVFNIEYAEPYVLGSLKDVFEAFAGQASIAIQCVKLHEELEQIGGRIGSQTLAEWVSNVGATWGHDVKSTVGKARTALEILTAELDGTMTPEQRRLLEETDQRLADLADIPLVAPLTTSEKVTEVDIIPHIEDFFTDRWETGRYSDILLNLEGLLDKAAAVKVSANWIRRLMDILMQNAVRAMRRRNSNDQRSSCLTIGAYQVNREIRITCRDNGPGIASELRDFIFERPISKKEGGIGSGMGLVLARIIARGYGGNLTLNPHVQDGAEFILSLPLVKEESPVEEVTHA